MWVTSVDRLQGVNGRNWLPGIVLEVCSVKVTVMLSDGRVICRHVDHVRRRATETPPERAAPPDYREGLVCEGAVRPAERPALDRGERSGNEGRGQLERSASEGVRRAAENRILRPRPTAKPDRFAAVWRNTGTVT